MLEIKSAQILFKTAEDLGLSPEWLSEYGLFSITVNRQGRYLLNSISALNSNLSAALANNKHAARVILDSNELPNIPYIVSDSINEVQSFLKVSKIIVIKPVIDAIPKTATLIRTPEELNPLKSQLKNSIVEKYIKGTELRYLVFDQKVIAVHKKQSTEQLFIDTSKVKRISYPRTEWNNELVTISQKVANVFQLRLCAVDFIVTGNQKIFILEVNSSPGIYRFEKPDSGPSIKLAEMILKSYLTSL